LTPASDGNYYHTVQSGEYLAYIADIYEISLTELLSWNGLTSSAVIYPGQKLLLRVTPPATETPVPVPSSPTPTATQTPPAPTPTQQSAPTNTRTPADTSLDPQSSTSRMLGPIVIVLLVFGSLILGWVLWKSKQNTSETNDT
ncbi:MAG: LysM peptidoglycan-binding domain-containing protein, partial [Anaerolineales bacterium]